MGGQTGTGNGQVGERGQMSKHWQVASGPASEHGQGSEWVGEQVGEQVWASVGRWPSG